MDLTVLIPFFNGHDTLGKLLKTLPSGLPVIVVDDVSDRPLFTVKRKNTRIIRMDKKGYFTGAVNRGLSEIKGDVLILNQDTYFKNNNWLNLLEEKSKTFGLVGEGITSHPAWPKGYIHGTFMYIRQDVYEKLGPMNEELYPLWGSTSEYQLRACRAGFKVLPIKNGSIPGFVHLRQRGYGLAIQEILKREGNRGLFLKTPPRISVIITSYNYGHYLEDAVNSLIGGKTSLGYFEPQSFPSFDIIIVDDNSKDDSLREAERLANDWKGVKVIARDKTGGTPAALNTGISSTRAHYITHLCADDMMESHRLQTLHTMAEVNPHKVIYDNLIYFQWGKRGMLTDSLNPHNRTIELGEPGIPDVYDFERVLQKNGMHTGIFYPKKAWEEVGGYSEIMVRGREDWQFNIALGIKGWCGIKARPTGYLYRREKQNRTLTNTTPKARLQFKKQIMSLYPEIYRGERPMGCCPGTKNKGNNTGADSMGTKGIAKLPGAESGFVILEYIGLNHGKQTWYANGTRYEFGLSSPIGYVAKDHVNILLAARKNKKPVFRVFVSKEPQIVLFDPGDLAISKLELDNYSADQLLRILELEQDGKNRTGAISKIQAALESNHQITEY